MARSVLVLPISIEQLAAVIRQMNAADRQRLLTLAPELLQDALQLPPHTPGSAQEAVERLRTEVLQALQSQRLSPDEPFVEGLTLGAYLALPDAERARLWAAWTEVDLDHLEEKDVRADAAPTRSSYCTPYPYGAPQTC
jgi:hypothetical protein